MRLNASGRVAWFLYRASVAVVVWTVLVPLELLRVALRLSTVDDLMEHLGASALPPRRPGTVRLLVHGVSLGETAAAVALIDQLASHIAGCTVVLTSGSPEARKAADRHRAQFPEIELCSYLPWDRASAIRRWLERLRPDAVVIMETEIWPNLFETCRNLELPLFIVSGRLYPGDVRRYCFARGFFGSVLEAVRWMGVQSARERDAFLRIGAPADRIEVVGNIKFDAARPAGTLPDRWRTVLDHQDAPLIVAGSTHAPEERWLLEALRRLRSDFPRLRLVLVPRHPGRAVRILRLAARRGFRAAAWSKTYPPAGKWDVLIVDQIGCLSELYRYADVTFIGGTLSRHGGHNILEAAAYGCTVLTGPSLAHVHDIVEALEKAGAILCLRRRGDRRELVEALGRLLSDEPARVEMGRRAKAVLDEGRGVSHMYLRAIARRMPGSMTAALDVPTGHQPLAG